MNDYKVFDGLHDGPHGECDAVGDHFHDDEWKAYWAGLSGNEKDSLKRKAKYEGMSISAIACSWGAQAGA